MTDPTSSRYGPASTDSTQWESCPLLIRHTLMDTVLSMNMNECNIYNILIPSSSLMSNIIKYPFHHHHHHSSSSSFIIIIKVCLYTLASFKYNQSSSSSLKNIHVSTSSIIINKKNTHVSTSFQNKSINII